MVSELADLARGLSRVSTARAVVPVVQASRAAVTSRLKSEASGHRHAPDLRNKITGNSILGGFGYEAGPLPVGAGKLENLYYFGSSRMAPQIPDPVIALRAQAPIVERKLADSLAAEIVRNL